MCALHLQVDLAGNDETDAVLVALSNEFNVWYRPKRQPTEEFRSGLNHTLEIVALNLISAAIAEPQRWIAIPSRPQWYQENRLLLGPYITHASMEKVVCFLRENRYVTFRKGKASSSVSFRRPNAIKPSSKFNDLLGIGSRPVTIHDIRPNPAHYPIRMKAAKDSKDRKPLIEFEPTGTTMMMADNISIINRALLRHWPDIEITDEQQREMLNRMSLKAREEVSLNLSRRTIYRVFSNGTFEDGGRFYGGWWQGIPKRYRPYITINGKQTVEVDYSAMHPTILYSELGLEMPDDPYEIGVSSREVVKRTFNALINAKGTNIKRDDGFSEDEAGMSWKEFLKVVKNHFSEFKSYFGTGYGLKLQRMDSDIAEAVMLKFAESGVPILPLHDSFIVHYGYESELQQVMQEEFEKRTGSKVKLKSVILHQRDKRAFDRSDEPITDDIIELLDLSGPYEGHDRRVEEHFSYLDRLTKQ